MDTDPDSIRQKRLAKLGGSASSPPSSPKPSPSKTTSSSVKPDVKKSIISSPTPAALSSTRSSVTSATTPTSTTTPTATSKSKTAAAERFVQLSDSEWEHKSLSQIFEVSLSPVEAASKKLLFLENLLKEYTDEGISHQFKSDDIDRVIYSRLSDPRNTSAELPSLFDYLLGVWKRCGTHQAGMEGLLAHASEVPDLKATVERRLPILKQVQVLAERYSGTVIHPDMFDSFPQNHSHGIGYLSHRLMGTPTPDYDVPRDFISGFLSHLDSEDIPSIIAQNIKKITAEMRTKKVYEDFQGPIRALTYLISFEQVSKLLPNLPDWIPNFANARTMEVMSILGPFFKANAVFPDTEPTIVSKYFESSDPFGTSYEDPYGFSIGARNWSDVKTAMKSLRDTSSFGAKSLQGLMLALIKASTESKEGVLSFISTVIKQNRGRDKLQVDRREVATDGFVYSILQVCLLLCDPIITLNFSKVSLIDPNYLTYTTRIDLTDITRLNADNHAVEDFTNKFKQSLPSDAPPNPNFVTEIFFLTLALHHYGTLSSIRQYNHFLKELEEMKKHVNRFQQGRDSGAWASLDAFGRATNEQMLKRLQTQHDKLIGVKLAMDVGLLDPAALDHSMRFYGLVMVWLMRVAQNDLNNKNFGWDRFVRGDAQGSNMFPLPNGAPDAFSVLPEWIIDDICEFYLFLARYSPKIFENHPRDEIMTFSMFLLMNPKSVKNPYLKSKLVELLFFFTIPLYRTASGETMGRLDGVFSTHPFSKSYLIKSLLNFYVDVEQTGMSSQFYDKFNIRYNISQIMKCVWTDPSHRKATIELSRDSEFFVKFIALLRNDTNYLLDEGLSKLKEIGQLQIELATPLPPSATQQDTTYRQEREGLLSTLERQAQSYMSLGNETVHLLSYLTADADIVDPFMAAEIVDNFAAMLNYNLAELAGPRCTELKVKNPEKYRFDPKRLLGELVDIYLHLSHRSEFVSAIAKDGRSYNKMTFERAGSILLRHHIRSPDAVSSLAALVDKVEATLASEQVEEEELGEIPDEFLDPVLFTLMEDPVTLPSSGVVVDLSTIKTHLLSDTHDPFNRQPLSLDQVIPNVELKNRIQAWKDGKKRKSNNDMDTSD